MQWPRSMETKRLRLTAVRLSDAAAIFAAYAQDAEVTKFLVWKPHQSVQDTRTFMKWCIQKRAAGTNVAFVLRLKSTGAAIGMIDLRPDGHRADIGYVLARPYWNQGYMSEATRAVVQMALKQPGIWRVEAVCNVANKGSARVMEKAGLQREGRLRKWGTSPNISPLPVDMFLYAKVKTGKK